MSTLALREYLESIEGKHAKVAEFFAAMRSTELLTAFAQEKGLDLSRTEADTLRHVVMKRDSTSTLSDRELEHIVGGVSVDAFLRYLR